MATLSDIVQTVKASFWKRTWIWIGGFLAILGALLCLMLVIRRKGPIEGTVAVVRDVQNAIDKADLEAQVKAAEAAKIETAVVSQLKVIQRIEDRKERLNRLADLMRQ